MVLVNYKIKMNFYSVILSFADTIDLSPSPVPGSEFCFGSYGETAPNLVFGDNPFTFYVDATVGGMY